MTSKKLAVLIPCHNEVEGIVSVINKFPWDKIKKNNIRAAIIVIDNNSTDGTAEVALSLGAYVIKEPKKGKGNAMRAGFKALPKDTDYVVMLDGDNTYDSREIMRMIEPLESGFCDVVIGSRLGGKMHDGAMRTFNRGGNWLFTHLVRIYYRVNVTDVLTGYYAWTKRSIDELHPHLTSDGFAIEMEMITKMARLGHEIYSVPISYTPRSGETNLRPIYDGRRIMRMYFSSMRWNAQKPSSELKVN